MSSFPRLKQTSSKWEFENAALEDFVWLNLENLLSFTPLKRQYCVNGQYCDILAVAQNQQLVILELKNSEDRYIIQQLTRYYDALLAEKPFSEIVDYSKPIYLWAIQPSFHRDNFTDIKYHVLTFKLLQFELFEHDNQLYFQFTDLEAKTVAKIPLPYQEKQSLKNIPSPPRKLLNILAKCPETDREGILQLRTNILSFDERIQEIIESGSIRYGRGKSKPCAELKFDNTRKQIALFLWLPLIVKGFKERSFIARMRIWTDWNTVSHLGHVPKGLGRMITKTEWKLGTVLPIVKLLPKHPESRQKFIQDQTYRESFIKSSHLDYYEKNESYRSPLALTSSYYHSLFNQSNSSKNLQSQLLDDFVNLALEKWIEKL